MNNTLRYSGIAGMITLLTSFPIILFEVLKSFNDLSETLTIYYIATLLISLFSYLIFIYGYILIGKYSKNNLLKIMSSISFISAIILNFFYIGSLYIPALTELIVSVSIMLVYGVIEIIFGISVLKLKGLFGGLATGLGVLLIITGISYLTIIFSILGVILLIPIYVLSTMILFKASKKFVFV